MNALILIGFVAIIYFVPYFIIGHFWGKDAIVYYNIFVYIAIFLFVMLYPIFMIAKESKEEKDSSSSNNEDKSEDERIMDEYIEEETKLYLSKIDAAGRGRGDIIYHRGFHLLDDD